MNHSTGLSHRVRERLRALGSWKRGRPDISRFCGEKGYRPQYVYAWLKNRVPTAEYLHRLADDLGVTVPWLVFGVETQLLQPVPVRVIETNTGAPALGPGARGEHEPLTLRSTGSWARMRGSCAR